MTLRDRLTPLRFDIDFRPLLKISLIGFALFTAACSTTNQRGFLGGEKGAPGSDDVFVNDFSPISYNDLVNEAFNDVFKAGDTADVKVYNVENLSGRYVVDRSGSIVFPLIGKVDVMGRSTQEVQQSLTELYGDRFLQDPSISVQLEALEVDLGKVVVDGAVNRPGVFDMDRVIRLSEAIALGQGLTPDASRSEIYVVRNTNGSRRVRVIDLKDVHKLGAEDPEIIPGDIVYVNESRSRAAFREFLRTVPIVNSILIYGTRR